MSNKNKHQTPEEKAAWLRNQTNRLTVKTVWRGRFGPAISNKPLSKEKRRRLEIPERIVR